MLALRSSSRSICAAMAGQSRAMANMTLETYRPKWPLPDFRTSEPVPEIPQRTIPDDKLRFQMTATMEQGTAIFYPHLQTNPANLKVRLFVGMEDLGLSALEQKVLVALVGPRYNTGKREIKLTAEKFPNRVENKKYLIFLLEQLVAEARKLAADQHNFQ